MPGGSLLCSMLFRPTFALERWYLFSMLVALAGLDACADAAGVDARASGRTISSSRVASSAASSPRWFLARFVAAASAPPSAAARSALVVGIGLNCNWGQAWEGLPRARRMRHLPRSRGGRPSTAQPSKPRLLEQVAERYAPSRGKTAGDAGAPERSLAAEYRRKLDTMGSGVRVELPDEVFTGRALDVDDAGRFSSTSACA